MVLWDDVGYLEVPSRSFPELLALKEEDDRHLVQETSTN